MTFVNQVLSGFGIMPVQKECCKAISSSWYRYNDQSLLDGMCDYGYHLPPNAYSYDAELAAECLNEYQKVKIANGANGYFLLTEVAMANCLNRPNECKKFMMVCVKDGELILLYRFILIHICLCTE